MVKAHSPINWQNEPSRNTPINEANLNKMDSTIGVLDDRIIEQDTSKLDKSTAYTMVKDISFNENNGVFTITLLNGSTKTIDTKLEKISINFSYNAETQQIEIILIDGTKQYIDISSLVSPIDFVDSDTIGWEVTTGGKVKAKVLNGSITEDMLQPNYLAEIKVETEKSAQSMANAKISENNAKQSELNAKASEEQALKYSNNAQPLAQSVSGNNPTATNSTDGKVTYLEPRGYTEQKTLSGKNLKYETFEKYSIQSNGTFSSNGEYSIHVAKVESGQTYVVTTNDDAGLVCGYFVDKPTISSVSYDNTRIVQASKVITIPTGISYVSFRSLYGYSTPQIELGETATTYEPYCGGVASPNPDYPQRIEANGDKGYFDGELVQGEYSFNNGTFTARDNAITNANLIECKENDNITINYEEPLYYISVAFYDESKVFISGTNTTSVSSATFTAPANAKFFRFSLNNYMTNLLIADAKHICVTINGNYAIPVKTTNKNIFGGLALAQALVDSGSTNVVLDESAGTVTYKHNTNYQDAVRNILFDDFKENTQYTIILKGTTVNTNNNVNVGIRYTDGNFEWLKLGKNISQVGKTIQKFSYNYQDNFTTTLNYNQCGVFEGVITEEEFEEYQETLANIPITEPLYEGDYIEVYADGSGREYREYGMIVVDNNTTLTQSSQDSHMFSVIIEDGKYPNSDRNEAGVKGYCSHYTNAGSYIGAISNKFGFGFGVKSAIQKMIVGFYTEYTTIADFKTWLQSNPMTVVYELAEPTSTPLTAEQVAEFMKLQTFNPVTHVTADGEVTMRYYCDNDSGETVSMLQGMVEDMQSDFLSNHEILLTNSGSTSSTIQLELLDSIENYKFVFIIVRGLQAEQMYVYDTKLIPTSLFYFLNFIYMNNDKIMLRYYNGGILLSNSSETAVQIYGIK